MEFRCESTKMLEKLKDSANAFYFRQYNTNKSKRNVLFWQMLKKTATFRRCSQIKNVFLMPC
jgi:hypothetical protein